MSDFSASFLNEDWDSLPGAPRVYVGAFGKHPGWNDHLDDIGLVTASLIASRRVLYANGIASQIESAVWDKEGPEKTLPGFDHLVLWRRPGETLVGRLWASRDGKGRALYPFVIVVHCVGLTHEQVVGVVLPALEAAGTACMAATGSGEVASALNETQQALRARFGNSDAGILAEDSAIGVSAWARHFSAERAPLERVLHHLAANFGAFEPGVGAWSAVEGAARSRTLRVPLFPDAAPAESLNAWLSFLATQLDPAAPLLALLPRGHQWLDVIVGEPAPTDFFGLRALPSALPPVTDIPYHLDDSGRRRLDPVFRELETGRLPSFSVLNRNLVSANRATADKTLAKLRNKGRQGFFGRLLNPLGLSSGTRFRA